MYELYLNVKHTSKYYRDLAIHNSFYFHNVTFQSEFERENLKKVYVTYETKCKFDIKMLKLQMAHFYRTVRFSALGYSITSPFPLSVFVNGTKIEYCTVPLFWDLCIRVPLAQ